MAGGAFPRTGKVLVATRLDGRRDDVGLSPKIASKMKTSEHCKRCCPIPQRADRPVGMVPHQGQKPSIFFRYKRALEERKRSVCRETR